MSLTGRARAKVNLFLHITGKRNNGYHNLESMVGFTRDIYDELYISANDSLSIEVKGTYSYMLPVAADNIILKAASLLNPGGKGAHITLVKNIPVASGIGGGSADAALAVKFLAKLWNIQLSEQKLLDLLLSIGADVPVCYYSKAAYFSGIGEQLEPVSQLPDIYILLVNPVLPLETKLVFTNWPQGQFTESLETKPKNFSTTAELVEFLSKQHNDLQETAIKLIPVIDTIIDLIKQQNGCMLARMTGSGSTCFGLFDKYEEAEAAKNNIKELHPDWWNNISIIN